MHLIMHKYAIAKQLLTPGEHQNIYSNMTNVLSSKHLIAIIPKRIDDRTEFYPTLDYSFHDAKKLEGVNSFHFIILNFFLH